MPIERMRRCASTVKPPIDTSAMRSIPRTSAASEIVSGLSGFDAATDAGRLDLTPLPSEFSGVTRRVEEHRDLRGLRHLTRDDQGELVEKALRVLHDADDLARDAADPPGACRPRDGTPTPRRS